MNKPLVALQLYTVRDFTEKDLPGTLRQVKEMGYEYVELAGMYGKPPAELKALLEEAGLKAISAHVPMQAFEEDLNGTVNAYKTLGCKFIGIPWLDNSNLPGGANWEKSKEQFAKITALCKEAGIKLLYHNHAHEFNKLPSGEYILDALFREMPEIETEIDTGWVHAVNIDPGEYIKKYAGRCPVVHLKDTDKNAKEDRPVGQGTQDMRAITKAAEESGASVFVAELDNAVGITSLEAAKQSLDFLRSLNY
jgi:sugar phosphate isomerase/epimerase